MQPRPEHPRPQFRRENWLNLNGTWRFAFDFGLSGEEKGWPSDPAGIDGEIVVPYCPESRLSGVAHTDFIPAAWYHRTLSVPQDWQGRRVFLHFGAVDYDCRAWVNGRLVGRHYGGSAPFAFDVTEALGGGENQLVVCARDDTRSGLQPRGKQSGGLRSAGCCYTRVTGIWQTVWLEARPETYVDSVWIAPDLDASRFVVTPAIRNNRRGLRFRATLRAEGKDVATVASAAAAGAALALEVPDPRPWRLADPFLYDLVLELVEGGNVIDRVESYAGLRKFHIEGNRFFLNNEPIFVRFVLDQGFYPEGVWTAPTDEDLKRDIELSKAVGFNGARLHQKVFEERFHYWADRLGYLTWAEFDDWGLDFGKPAALLNHQTEWGEIILRDRNHPSIVAWSPFNETHGHAAAHPEIHRRHVQDIVDLTRALDPTRPVNDTSGYVHVDTDIYTVHNYDQDPEKFREAFAALTPEARDGFFRNSPELTAPYRGQPYVVDEYGGTWWNEEAARQAEAETENTPVSWGYGKRPRSADEVCERIEKLSEVLTSHPHVAGFTYTQLTDIEQEQNGVYYYDRTPKFDAARLRAAFGAPAAIEKGETGE
jgi:beta-galactosidase/beta-glucuronidase